MAISGPPGKWPCEYEDETLLKELDCVISYFFQLHLMLHTCIRTFDVTGTLEKNLGTKRGFSMRREEIEVL